MVRIHPPPAQRNGLLPREITPRRGGRVIHNRPSLSIAPDRPRPFLSLCPIGRQEMRRRRNRNASPVCRDKSERALPPPGGDARAVVVDRRIDSTSNGPHSARCRAQLPDGWARAGRRSEATDRRRLSDFGGRRSFFTTSDRRGHLGGNRRDGGRGLGRQESVLASTEDLRSRILTRSSRTLARRSNTTLTCRIHGSGASAGVALVVVHEAAVVLLLQDPLIAARVLELRQVAVNLRQVETEAVLLGGTGDCAAVATP